MIKQKIMKKENLSNSLEKLTMTMSLIVGIGAVLGIMGYYCLLNQEIHVNIVEEINKNKQENTDTKETKEIVPEYNNENLPNFSDFPVSSIYMGSISLIDFSSNKKSAQFKTALNRGIEGGPNFAGSYSFISWGCGTECQAVAIVNAKNGDVYFAPFSSSYDVEFHLDSSLIIVNPKEKFREVYGDEIPYWLKTYYYDWNRSKLELIYELDYQKNKTVGWKTYRNEEYGYEVEYPEEKWVLTSNIHGPILAWADGPINSLDDVNLYTQANEEAITVTFSVYEKDANLSMLQWFSSAIPDISKADKGDLTEALKKANMNTIGLLTYDDSKNNDIEISELGVAASSGYFSYVTYFHKTDFSFVYSVELRLSLYYTPTPEEYIDVYNQILSTFKFIEK